MVKPITTRKKAPASRGFTLAEMLIVVAVIVIVTSIVLANNSRFGGTVLLQNLAFDIALSTREAQVYSISVTRFGSSFTTPFGVNYDLSTPTTYTIFADANNNGVFDTGELVQSTNISRGFFIGDLCTIAVGGSQEWDCSTETIDIVYKHPEPDAYIRAVNCAAPDNPVCLRAQVKVSSPRGDELCIHTDFNGQISVRSCT